MILKQEAISRANPARPSWNGLPAAQPLARNALNPGIHHNDATDNGTCGIAITQPTHSSPKGLLVVAQVSGGTPQRKWDSIRSGHSRAVSKPSHSFFNR